MQLRDRLQLVYLLHLCRPQADRVVCRAIYRNKANRILELGLSSARRTLRMLKVARLACPTTCTYYAAIDLFEDRPAGSEIVFRLRDAYCTLRRTGAKVRLTPAPPVEGLMRTANELGKIDLLVIAADALPEEQSRAWFFLPRLLHQGSQVFAERRDRPGHVGVERLFVADIDRLAAAAARRAA